MPAKRSIAGDVDLLGMLSDDARSRLLLGSRSYTFSAGTVTFASPTPVADVVESGLVRIFVRSVDGRQASFAYVHAPSFYGAPTIAGASMSTSAQTLTETRLIRLDFRLMSSLFEEDLEIAKALAHVMASRIAQAARLVTVRSLGTVRERLAYDLLERASDQLLRGGISNLRVTHEELALSIGSAREVVSRAIAGLRNAGVVKAAPGVVSVLDVEGLAAIVEGLVD